MAPADIIIWQRFLTQFPFRFDRVDYDVAVGDGAPLPINAPDNIKADFQQLTKKRIDAVGYKGNTATIIEVKPRAGLSALGQLTAYLILYKAEFPDIQLTRSLLITEQLNPDESTVYDRSNIDVEIV